MHALMADPRLRICGFAEEHVSASLVLGSRADVLLSAGYGSLLDSHTRSAARLGSVGIHPGMLPKYRGSWPLWWALRAHEREVGLTLFELGPRLDDGPIIEQIGVLVDRGDTFRTLYDRVVLGVPYLVRSLADALERSDAMPTGQPQDDSQATTYRTPGIRDRVAMKVRCVWSAKVSRPKGRAGLRDRDGLNGIRGYW